MLADSLTGTIPSNVSKCRNLQTLVVKSNQMFGQVPSEIGMLTKLELFDMSQNRLSGTVPNQVCNLDKLGSLQHAYADCDTVSCRCCVGCN